jgi:N utilization substance protein B
MRQRARAREVALQLLFQHDQNPKPMARPQALRFAHDRLSDPGLIDFCMALFDGVLVSQQKIDAQLTKTADNWRLHRMMPADRNVLRMASYELLHAPTREPAPAVINEAIELARRFGSEDSPKFVNGILDQIAKSAAPGEKPPTPTAAETPVPTPTE